MTRRRAPYYDKANGVWVGAVYLGVDGKGRALRRKVSAKTEAACLKKLVELEREVSSGAVLAHAPEKTTMAAWLTRWLEAKTSQVGPNTAEDYRSKTQVHLIPRLGKVLLQKLTPLHCSTLFRDLERDGVGRRTQQLVHVVLNQALKEALALEMIAKNPLANVQRPRIDRSKRRRKDTWTIEHVRAFLVEASSHDLAALFVLAVMVGMRQSEILGLLWENVDLQRGILRVEWALHEVRLERHELVGIDPRCGPGLELAPTKTESSQRTIALPARALEALRAHRAKAQTSTSPFVFVTSAGAPIRARWLASEWARLLKRVGVPALPFKQLRHTCLTLLAEEGVPLKAAQALAGHSTPTLTAGVYQQATARLAREPADAMDRAVGPLPDAESD